MYVADGVCKLWALEPPWEGVATWMMLASLSGSRSVECVCVTSRTWQCGTVLIQCHVVTSCSRLRVWYFVYSPGIKWQYAAASKPGVTAYAAPAVSEDGKTVYVCQHPGRAPPRKRGTFI